MSFELNYAFMHKGTDLRHEFRTFCTSDPTRNELRARFGELRTLDATWTLPHA